MTADNFTFQITRIPFNEDYQPADGTRITTNFANLARGASRRENLRNTIRMIDRNRMMITFGSDGTSAMFLRVK